MDDVSGPEDAAILSVLAELCVRFEITEYKPKKISWVGAANTRKDLPSTMQSDAVFFWNEEVLLSDKMKGRLAAEEWRPIFASAIAYESFSKARRRGVFLRTLVTMGLVVPFFMSMIFAATSLVPTWINITAGIVSVCLAALMVISGRRLGSAYRKRLWLKADTVASELLGREAFLGTFRRVIGLGLHDVRRLETNKLARYFSSIPSITERTENLLTVPATPSPREGLTVIIVLTFLSAAIILPQGIIALLITPFLEPASFGIETGALGFLALAAAALLLQNGLRIYRTERGFVKLAPFILIPSIAYWLSFAVVAAIRNGSTDISTVVTVGLSLGVLGPAYGVFAGLLLLLRKRATLNELLLLGVNLRDGDICYFNSGSGDFGVAKILKIEESRGKKLYHIRLYKERFQQPPKPEELGTLSLGSYRQEHFGIGHMPMSEIAFLAWIPIPIKNEPVTEDELDGYYIWKRDTGGVWE